MSVPRRGARRSRASSSGDRIELQIGLLLRAHWGRHESEREHVERLRAAWERRGLEVLDDCQPGRRPWAWWVFERGEEPPDPGDELGRLVEMGVLGERELRAIADAGDAFVERWPPPYLSVPQAVHDGNVARAALRLPMVEVRVLGGGE